MPDAVSLHSNPPITSNGQRLWSFDGTEQTQGRLIRPDRYGALFAAIQEAAVARVPCIARGGGLSYCSASAGDGVLSVLASEFNRVLEFSETELSITVESGMKLGDLLKFLVPRGFWFPVLPGHPDITVGGAIGFNVHGKSQSHDGHFVDHVISLSLFHPKQGEIFASRTQNAEVFALTSGGFGLTGFITHAVLRVQRLKGQQIKLQRVRVANLTEAVETMASRKTECDLLYSWNDLNARGDAFGRGVVYLETIVAGPEPELFNWKTLGAEARRESLARALGALAFPWISRVYSLGEKLKGNEAEIDLLKGAFPIVGKEIYYQLFGHAGFREYQLLVPFSAWPQFVSGLRTALSAHRLPITLGSLKLFSGAACNLEFKGEGVCLAIDVPASHAASDLFATLDTLAIGAGGIGNISKDSRLSQTTVKRMYPMFDEYRSRLRAYDPQCLMGSALRERLGL